MFVFKVSLKKASEFLPEVYFQITCFLFDCFYFVFVVIVASRSLRSDGDNDNKKPLNLHI